MFIFLFSLSLFQWRENQETMKWNQTNIYGDTVQSYGVVIQVVLFPPPTKKKKRFRVKKEMMEISWNEKINQHQKSYPSMDIINIERWSIHTHIATSTNIEYHSCSNHLEEYPSTTNNKQWKWHDPHHLQYYYRPRTLSKYNHHRYGLWMMMIFHRTRWMMLLLFHRTRSIIILLPHNHIHPPWLLS